jgi:hypothetical protein
LHNGEDDEKYKSFTDDSIFNIVEYKKKNEVSIVTKKKSTKKIKILVLITNAY